MDVHVAINIDVSSYAGDLASLDLPAMVAQALAAKLAGEIELPTGDPLKVVGVVAVYENWPPKA